MYVEEDFSISYHKPRVSFKERLRALPGRAKSAFFLPRRSAGSMLDRLTGVESPSPTTATSAASSPQPLIKKNYADLRAEINAAKLFLEQKSKLDSKNKEKEQVQEKSIMINKSISKSKVNQDGSGSPTGGRGVNYGRTGRKEFCRATARSQFHAAGRCRGEGGRCRGHTCQYLLKWYCQQSHTFLDFR